MVKMIDINYIINQEIINERLLARSELAKEILNIIKSPESQSDYVDRVYEVNKRLSAVIKEYQKFKSGIPI